MSRRSIVTLTLGFACVACSERPAGFDWAKYHPPDWRRFQARDTHPAPSPLASGSSRKPGSDRVTFQDLKTESDQSLAERLLGLVGRRVTYIDRHKDRWRYYDSDRAAAESIDLYTHPDRLGSQYGLCGVEKYSIAFDDAGRIESVAESGRYGVEGAVLQKNNFNWDFYEKRMCAAAPASHAPSYFPAEDGAAAQDLAMLLIPAIDLAASPTPLPYKLECHAYGGRACVGDIRRYLGVLRFEDVDKFTRAKCPSPAGPQAVCFTVETGAHRLGPFPKLITVTGSTYMNNVRVDAIDVVEGFTIS